MSDEQFMAWCKERGFRFNFDEDSKEHYITMSLDDLQNFYIDVQEFEAEKAGA